MTKIIWLDTLKDTALWTFRSWCAGYPVPPYADDRWLFTDALNPEMYYKDMQTYLGAWNFLRPFFKSRGYTLYVAPFKNPQVLLPDPGGPAAHPSPAHPFARRAFEDDSQVVLCHVSLRVWPARDAEGREVIIKLVSGRTPSDELKVLQRLNSESIRSDYRNHTIHALEYIHFDELVFVVMPRWPSAFRHDFGSVSEIFQCLQQMLEVLDFLHENRISHSDLIDQNIGANVITDQSMGYLTGMRDLSVTRYALYDFGASHIFSMDADIQSVKASPKYVLVEPGTYPPVNPFQEDMRVVGQTMERHVRHLEAVIPDLGEFFESLQHLDPCKRPSARDALQRCQTIYSSLTQEQLSYEVAGRYWRSGQIITKIQYPLYKSTIVPESEIASLSML